MCRICILLSIIGVVLFCAACNGHVEKDVHNVPMIIGYDSLVENPSIISDVDIVQLELTDESCISSIQKIQYLDSVILIHDASSGILLFDKTGKFLFNISKQGRASNEYLRLNTFIVDSLRHIRLFDSYTGRVLTYDLFGNYIETNTYPGYVFRELHDVILLDNKYILNHNIMNDDGDIYSSYDLNIDSREVLYRTTMQTTGISMPIGKHPFACFNDTVFAIIPFDNVIYTVTEFNKLSPYRVISTEKELLSEQKMSLIDDYSINSVLEVESVKKFPGFSSIYITNSYILLDYWGAETLLIDKKSGVGIRTYSAIDEDSNNMPLLNVCAATQDSFVGFLTYRDVQKIKNIKSTNAIIDKILHATSGMDYDSNPSLVIYTLN